MKTLVFGAVVAALLHITPTVVLVKRQDAVNHLLPGADQFAAREVHLSSTDSRRVHDAVGWKPPDGMITFYIGKHQEQVTGALIFMASDSQHGHSSSPSVSIRAETVRGVEVTKATVETKPWVLEACGRGSPTRIAARARSSASRAEKVKSHIGRDARLHGGARR